MGKPNARARRRKKRLAEEKGKHSAIISEIHTIEKRLAAARNNEQQLSATEKAELLKRQAALGGLEAYQDVSLSGTAAQRGGQHAAKWLVQAIHGRELQTPINLLDVGAIDGVAYSKYHRWIKCTSIDLCPRSENVQRCDFIEDFQIPAKDNLFDVVALSLVLNFVGSLSHRAQMISKAHACLKPSGILFLVLPRACLDNSRYMDHDRLGGIFSTLGFPTVLTQHDSAKLSFWLFQSSSEPSDGKKWPRTQVRSGSSRNNFVIIV